MLVCERVPAESGEVEDEPLWCDPRLLSGRRERGHSLVDSAPEEPSNAGSVTERLALHEAQEVLVTAEEIDESADVRLDSIFG